MRPRYLLRPTHWEALLMQKWSVRCVMFMLAARLWQDVLERVYTKPLEHWYVTTLLNTELLRKRWTRRR